jgi:hypothetical protein
MVKKIVITLLGMIGTLPLLAWTTNVASGIRGHDVETITFLLNATNCPSDIKESIQEAMDLWNSAPGNGLYFKLGGSSSLSTASFNNTSLNTNRAIIGCSTNFVADSGTSAATAGAASVADDGTNIVQGFVILNVQTGLAGDVSVKSKTYRSIVVAHEMAHAVGLGHSEEKAALMYYAAVKSQLRLHQDDIDGMSFLYPKDELAGDAIMGCGVVNSAPPTLPLQRGLWLVAFMMVLLSFGLRKHARNRTLN